MRRTDLSPSRDAGWNGKRATLAPYSRECITGAKNPYVRRRGYRVSRATTRLTAWGGREGGREGGGGEAVGSRIRARVFARGEFFARMPPRWTHLTGLLSTGGVCGTLRIEFYERDVRIRSMFYVDGQMPIVTDRCACVRVFVSGFVSLGSSMGNFWGVLAHIILR
jgi:hypothetical protein